MASIDSIRPLLLPPLAAHRKTLPLSASPADLMQDGGPSPINDNRTDKIASGWQITRPCIMTAT